MRPQDVVLLLCPLVTATPTLLQLGLLLPLSTAIHLPIPHHQVWQCFAHIKHLKHKHITSGLVRFFPSPLPLVHLLTLPQQVLPQYMARWLYVWVIWGSIECES